MGGCDGLFGFNFEEGRTSTVFLGYSNIQSNGSDPVLARMYVMGDLTIIME